MKWPRKRERPFRRQVFAWLHVDQALWDVNLVVGHQDHVFFGMSFFDDALKIDIEFLPVFAGDLHLTFVGKVAKPARANDGLAERVTFIRRNFLWPLCFHGTVNINSAARFFAYPIDGENDGRMIIILFLKQTLDRVSEFLASSAFGGHQAD